MGDAEQSDPRKEADRRFGNCCPRAGSVQASLARETVVWRQGLLVMPPIVRTLVTALQRLQDRLSALELSILQVPARVFHTLVSL